MDKKQKALLRKQEDTAFNRAMIWVGVAIVFELLLLLVNRYYFNFTTNLESLAHAHFAENALLWARVVGLGCILGGGAHALAHHMGKASEAKKPAVLVAAIGAVLVACAFIPAIAKALGLGTLLMQVGVALAVMGLVCMLLLSVGGAEKPLALSGTVAAVGVLLFLCAHITLAFQQAGLQMLLLLVPACAGIALVFYLYQREFFYSTVFSALGLLVLWMKYHSTGHTMSSVYIFFAAAVVVIGGMLYLLRRAKDAGIDLRPVQLSAAISLALPLAAIIFGAGVAYYLIFALLAWLFALLVYYTVKML